MCLTKSEGFLEGIGFSQYTLFFTYLTTDMQCNVGSPWSALKDLENAGKHKKLNLQNKYNFNEKVNFWFNKGM